MLTEKLKNVHRLQGKLMFEHYQRALAAKSEGRPVAYVTAMFPVEIVKAFEPHLATVYPENGNGIPGKPRRPADCQGPGPACGAGRSRRPGPHGLRL
jgi:hypothetical protein